MKKHLYIALLIGFLFPLMGTTCFAENSLNQRLSNRLTQEMKQAESYQQIALFMEQLAQKSPAKFAELLLQRKLTYVHDDSIIYIGVKSTGEVLVICQIDDFEVGTFYYVAHKKGDRIFEQSPATAPSTQDFATLFKRKLSK